MPLTKRQNEILVYLQGHIQDQGYAPSFEEIAEHFGFQSLATVHEHLTNLERKGYIRRSYNESRSIEVLPPRGTSAASEVPLLGKVAAGTPIESLMHQETIAVPDQMLPRRGPNYALKVQGESRAAIRRKVPEVLSMVGLSHKMNSLPDELSGGEQQRVSIARALLLSPELVLADEPTGNLDSKSGREVLRVLRELNEEEGHTIVMVTHDAAAAATADRVIFLRDGKLAGEVEGGSTRRAAPSATG